MCLLRIVRFDTTFDKNRRQNIAIVKCFQVNESKVSYISAFRLPCPVSSRDFELLERPLEPVFVGCAVFKIKVSLRGASAPFSLGISISLYMNILYRGRI
jgi:hypothetical protein